MTDLLHGSAWWVLPVALLSLGAGFGFLPGFLLRLLVLLYPDDDPRRRELVAELYVLGRMERIEWVFQQLETALFEGVSARVEQRRNRRHDGRADESGDEAAGRRVPSEADETEETRRRTFVAVAASIASGAVVRDPDSGFWVPDPVLASAPAWIGVTHVRELEAAGRAFRALDSHYGCGFSGSALVVQLARGQQMLCASSSDPVKRRLQAALADLHNLAGWASFRNGRIDRAHDHFGRALELARQAAT
ncbi:MAG TPA: tetratricopeptide repeat protein [Actinophytocola sp.]|jgi:hypothetical protein|nr:tetratricopeptide repeat protein [Actinophytocola sp.]